MNMRRGLLPFILVADACGAPRPDGWFAGPGGRMRATRLSLCASGSCSR